MLRKEILRSAEVKTYYRIVHLINFVHVVVVNVQFDFKIIAINAITGIWFFVGYSEDLEY